jgi:hypothetical protein
MPATQATSKLSANSRVDAALDGAVVVVDITTDHPFDREPNVAAAEAEWRSSRRGGIPAPT